MGPNNLKVVVERIFSGLANNSLSVDHALRISMDYINILTLRCEDKFLSLDLLNDASLSGSENKEETSSMICKIPESVANTTVCSGLAQTAANIVRIACNKETIVHGASPLKFWKGERVNIFFDPLMIGFASEECFGSLGWGSSRAASYLAQCCAQAGNSTEVRAGRVAIILTRHPSKYAHFIRDRLTKIVWCEFLSGMGPFDEYIFDYPLAAKEIECLRDLGIVSRFLYAAHLGRFFTVIGNHVVVIEVTSGMSLLPSLSRFLMNKYPTSEKAEKIFLSRGYLGSRRMPFNNREIEDIFKHFNYRIVDIAGHSYIDQLRFCSNSLISAGFHGAQLINAHNSNALIELHTFPYCASSWAETMLKMAVALRMPYVPMLLSSSTNSSEAFNYEDKPLRYLENLLMEEDNNPLNGQTSQVLIDVRNLGKALELAESLVEKLKVDIA